MPSLDFNRVSVLNPEAGRRALGITTIKGDKGDKGDKGEKGDAGADGVDATASRAVLELTADYTIKATDDVLVGTAAGITLTLPPSVSVLNGKMLYIKNMIGGVGNVTVDIDGTDTIDGGAAVTLANTEYLILMRFGSNWIVLSKV